MNALLRNKRKSAALTAYALVTLAVVGARWQAYAGAPTVLVPIARASAAGVYLNCALVLLPMMRLALSRPALLGALRVVLPVHQAIEAHAIAGTAIVAFSAIHVLAYGGILAGFPDVFWGVARPLPLWTGVALTPLLAALAVGAAVRTRGRFEAFYYTHFLSIPFGVLCLLHAPWFGAIVGLPLALFLLDRLARVAVMTRTARIQGVRVDRRDLELLVDRPPTFAYRAGDYAFLCVPALSRLQWHPFSLINAPSEPGGLRFRIRRAGAWTSALAELAPGDAVYVDGPFASPSRDLHECRRAVIVAGGIGITPFASFLAEARASGAAFQRVHLYWLERDVDSFGAFRPLIDELEQELDGRLIVTLVAGEGRDPLPRLVTTTPVDWDAELARLAAEGMAGSTVFFCGSPGLSHRLRVASRAAGFRFRTECF